MPAICHALSWALGIQQSDNSAGTSLCPQKAPILVEGDRQDTRTCNVSGGECFGKKNKQERVRRKPRLGTRCRGNWSVEEGHYRSPCERDEEVGYVHFRGNVGSGRWNSASALGQQVVLECQCSGTRKARVVELSEPGGGSVVEEVRAQGNGTEHGGPHRPP